VGEVEILLWLAPPVVVTVVAMLWVSWVGRERSAVDRDEAVRRLGAALEKEPRTRRTPRPAGSERTAPARSSGVAVRRTPPRPRGLPRNPDVPPAPSAPVRATRRERRERRAS
jgi:hypothetical protein